MPETEPLYRTGTSVVVSCVVPQSYSECEADLVSAEKAYVGRYVGKSGVVESVDARFQHPYLVLFQSACAYFCKNDCDGGHSCRFSAIELEAA